MSKEMFSNLSCGNEGEFELIKVFVYDEQVKFDLSPKLVGGKVWVSVESTLELMNFDFVPNDNGFIIKSEASYAEFKFGKSEATMNGCLVQIEKPYKERLRIWLDLDSLMLATNSTYKWSEEDKTVVILAPVLPYARPATDADIIIMPQFRTATYIIPIDDPTAQISVWTLAKTSGNEGWRKGQNKWWREYPPVYALERMGFLGTLTYLDEDVDNKVRVRVRKNGIEDIFECGYHTENAHIRTLHDLAYDAKRLTLVSTFHNISVYLNSPISVNGDISNTVMYKEEGTDEWKQAFRLYYDDKNDQFRGSIVLVEEDTTYQVKVILNGKNGEILYEETATVTTWKSDVLVARVIDIKELYVPGQNIVLQNICGSEDGWIKVMGDGETVIDVSDEFWEAIFVAQSEYLILENLRVKGAYRHGIHILDNSRNIRVINCEISNWGRAGNLDESRGNYVDHTGASINNEAGIYYNDVTNIVIERCYIHDPKGRANAWNGRTWNTVHPQGPCAVYGRSREGIVARYNDFIGSDEHRWNDSFESYHNMDKWGGFACDSDVYGNYQAFGQDDSTELDGSQMNVRYYGNKAEGFLCGVSTACTTVGPSYLFRNLILNLGDDVGKHGGAVKNGQVVAEWTGGFSTVMHNTFIGSGIAQTSGYYLVYARNNIIDTLETGRLAAEHTFLAPGVSFDYDLYYKEVVGPAGSEDNGICGKASFVNMAGGDYRLTENSLGIDKGEQVPNFSDKYLGSAPDMGAIEFGEDALMPIRPINIRADKYQINLRGNGTDTVTFKIGKLKEGMKYKIMKNDVFEWFSVEGEIVGELKPNSEIAFRVIGLPDKVLFVRPSYSELMAMKVTAVPEDIDERLGNGAFTLRLEDGFSVPITVYLMSAK